MAETFFLEILTPERSFFSGQVESVILKTSDGEMGVLKNHLPMVVPVEIGPVRIKKDSGEWVTAALTSGFMEIRGNKAVILADTAEWPEEIDVNRALAAKQRAEERLNHILSSIEYSRSQHALSRAITRIKVTKDL